MPPTNAHRRPLILVLEGVNDFDFLYRLTNRLLPHLRETPDRSALINSGEIAFIALGVGSPKTWPHHLTFLHCREFHPYDREQAWEAECRRAD